MAIRNRRQGREAALRALYQMEIGGARLGDTLADMRLHLDADSDVVTYAEELVSGIWERRAELDERIAAALIEWTLDRVAPIERNLMRIALFELWHRVEVPPAVSLDEAVELAKKYASPESGKFVNGVLGRLLAESPKRNWTPPPTAEEAEPPAPEEPAPEVEETTVEADSPEAEDLGRIGRWQLRADEEPS